MKKESKALAAQEDVPPEMLERLVLNGDLSGLDADQRVGYYQAFCKRLGLDPVTQPLKLLKLDNKIVLYCDRGGCQQLNQLHKVSHTILSREVVSGCYVVTARASTADRQTENIGAVALQKPGGKWEWNASKGKNTFKSDGSTVELVGEERCNAMMKAESKAKRRATLDLVGLGLLSEDETPDGSTRISLDDPVIEERPIMTATVVVEPESTKDWKAVKCPIGKFAGMTVLSMSPEELKQAHFEPKEIGIMGATEPETQFLWAVEKALDVIAGVESPEAENSAPMGDSGDKSHITTLREALKSNELPENWFNQFLYSRRNKLDFQGCEKIDDASPELVNNILKTIPWFKNKFAKTKAT